MNAWKNNKNFKAVDNSKTPFQNNHKKSSSRFGDRHNHRASFANSFKNSNYRNYPKKNYGNNFHEQNKANDFIAVPIQNDPELVIIIKNAVLHILKNDSKPILIEILIKKTIYLIKQEHKKLFLKENNIFWVIQDLVNEEIVAINNRGKYYLSYFDLPEITNSLQQGVFYTAARGPFGFVKVKKDDDTLLSFFVHKKDINNAIDGDIVEFVELDTTIKKIRKPNVEKTNNGEARIKRILEHTKDSYVGEVFTDGFAKFVRIDNPRFKDIVKINNSMGLVDGHKVLVKISKFAINAFEGDVVKLLGHKNDVGVDIESIVYDFGLNVEFPVSVLGDIKKIDHSFDRFQKQKCRRDLTRLPFVTIDPTESKDFDDAIYVEQISADQFKLFVAIADVASYVSFNSNIDQEAQNRGTSVYLVNSVIPMLPHVLSNDLCSLNPEQMRCAIVCEMQINADGVVWAQTEIYPALIRSQMRFSYDQVNNYFKTKAFEIPINDAVHKNIDVAYQLFFLMEKNKQKRGYINFDLPEAKIVVDNKNKPLEIKVYERYHAQIMIENFMVAANEAVAYFLEHKRLPGVFRIHDKPKIEALQEFRLRAKTLNFNVTTKIDADIHSKDIAKWLSDNENNSYSNLINMALLRCMSKAVYADTNLFHFGLASNHYLHFTSPIRRYPDVIVHRILWMYVFEPEKYLGNERANFVSLIPELVVKNNAAEVLAVDVERAVNAYKFTEYMTQFLDQTFTAIVTSFNSKGFYVQLPNTIEGYCLLVDNVLDYFEFFEERQIFVGKNTNQIISWGTQVLVRLIRTDLQFYTIEFSLEQIIKNP